MSLSERLRDLKQRATGLGPLLTEQSVAKFETEHGITLPEEYRRFLLEVGNGGKGPPHYGLMALGEMPNDHHRSADEQLARLGTPFPLEEAWIWENEPELSDEQNELIESVGYGSLVLGTDGCGMYWHLVVSGRQRGQVWNVTGEGATPCIPGRDFASWYERWLGAGDAHDWWFDGANG